MFNDSHEDKEILNSLYFQNIIDSEFTDIPQRTNIEEYERTKELLISYWTKLKVKPVAIYQIGEVLAPGISDLDFIIVYSDDVTLNWHHYKPSTFPNWVQRIMTHAPYVCTESSWTDLQLWFPVFNIRHLWGEMLPEANIVPDISSGVAFGMLVDYLIVKVPSDFFFIAWDNPIRLRILLCMLNSLQHTYRLAEMADIGVSKEYRKLSRKISTLRSNWFDLGKERFYMLRDYVGLACKLSGDLVELVDKILSSKTSCFNGSIPKTQRYGTGFFKFETPWQFKSVMQDAFEGKSRNGSIDWTNPNSFAMVLSFYARVSPTFRTYLSAKGFQVDFNWDGGRWREGLKHHVHAMIDYAVTSSKIGVPSQKYIAFGYSPKFNNPLPIDELFKKVIIDIMKGQIGPKTLMRKILSKVRSIQSKY